MKDILFIINPLSVLKMNIPVEELISDGLSNTSLSYDIKFSEYHRHAIEITHINLKNYSVFCAAGGDGTVNHVSSVLVNTGKTLGIIPLGSGNGLAHFLKLPANIKECLKRIISLRTITIDSGLINNHHFINIAGIGFDAQIAHLYAKSEGRGFKKYISKTAKTLFRYKPEEYLIFPDGNEKRVRAFLIAFCNSNQFGNNAIICPGAIIDDNMMSVSILKPFPFYHIPVLVYRLFKGNIDKSDYVECIPFRKCRITNRNKTYIHIDGEPETIEGDLEIQVIPNSIQVIV